ncbi:MAG: class I SAM-dependent methyltransferase [Chitinophagia bacterium]|nr:class I SAM-dependent methyltransferase [Chitinophagia bacterium]
MSNADASLTREQYLALRDPAGGYPANHFAFQPLLNVLHDQGASTMLEVGIGHGNAIQFFHAAGLDIWGVEIDQDLVAKSKATMERWGLPADRVVWGDIEDAMSLSGIRRAGPFDAVLAMGVLPHVTYDLVALQNMRTLVAPGGRIFVECRNKLFSLFTFNRYTYEFIMDDLLADVPEDLRAKTSEFLQTRVDAEVPPRPTGHAPRFHNPLDVDRIFIEAGFTDVVIRPFHYHASLPRFESSLGAAFREASIALENEPSGWRGLFLCSAFVVEARRPQEVTATY